MIPNLKVEPLAGFASGRVTTAGNAPKPDDSLEIAKNVVLHSNGIQRIKGYVKTAAALAYSIVDMFKFEREVDAKDFLITTGGGKITLCQVNGETIVELKNGQASDDASMVEGPHSAYLSNRDNIFTLYDGGDGNATARACGLKAPAFQPTLTFIAGALSLTYGRRYVVCEVVYWTDSQGVIRYHIGPPSNFTAHTGPQSAQTVQVHIGPATNPATTHFWIFATEDSEADTSASYSFAAEVTAATTVWGDTLTDDLLDTIRPAPFDNLPPPASEILIDYEGRIAIIDGDLIQFTGGVEDIVLGVPQETAPLNLQFRIPSGSKRATGGANYGQSLMVCNDDDWFQIRGSSLADFTKRDKIMSPGAAGRKLILATKTFLIWLSRSKVLWAWDGVYPPFPISSSIAEKGARPEILSMGSISEAVIADGELFMVETDVYTFLGLAVSTTGTDVKDWIQLWDITDFMAGRSKSISETDFVPAHSIVSTLALRVSGLNKVYLGANDGSIYDWPNGTQFDDQPIIAVAESPLSLLDFLGTKLMHWMDIFTNRDDAAHDFKVYAGKSDSLVVNNVAMVQVQPQEEGIIDDTMARFRLQTPLTAMAKFFKWRIVFPSDDNDATVDAISIARVPKPGIYK